MSDNTSIEWTRGNDGTPGATWNPVTGCTEVSTGCDRCYAKTFAERWRGIPGHHFERGFDVTLRPERLEQPLKWRKSRRIFVNSMSDLFHAEVPDRFIAKVFAVMVAAPHHTFQLLTKRHGRMRSLLSSERFWVLVSEELGTLWRTRPPAPLTAVPPWIWLVVSVENQQWADIRLPALWETPAAVRGVSLEPLVGPVDLDVTWQRFAETHSGHPRDYLNWAIVGGESGHGARPMRPQWARNLRDQCQRAGIPFFFKQTGSVLARELGLKGKGDDIAQFPEDLRIRQFPAERLAVTS